MKDNMYYGAGSLIFQRAAELRSRMTPAEEVLWKHVHINQWKLKFRRQHPIWNYIADFYCHPIKLVIELDGGIHEEEEVKRHDEERENHLKSRGITVLRFKNREVLQNIDTVLNKISETIDTLRAANAISNSAQSSPSPLGDGGEKLFVIKIGGNIIDDEEKLSSFLQKFAALFVNNDALPGAKGILVHGGGKLATRLGEALGIEQKLVDGRRITDAETLKIVTMVYAGLINKNIVAQLQSHDCNAIGLSGADGNVILAHKRITPPSPKGEFPPSGDGGYGFAGDVDNVNAAFLHTLLSSGNTVVLAPITHNGKGQLLNTNADTIAQETAKAMAAYYDVSLIYSFEKAGVLLDVNDDASVIRELTPAYYEQLKPSPSGEGGKIFAGMIPKLDNAFAALNSGVQKVIIGKAEDLEGLIAGSTGTTIVNE